MSVRSVTNRNFWGGFWGGLVGLLSFAWIHPAAMPFGCLGGVVAGFWYQEIRQLFATSFPRVFASARELRRQFQAHPMNAGTTVVWLANILGMMLMFWFFVFLPVPTLGESNYQSPFLVLLVVPGVFAVGLISGGGMLLARFGSFDSPNDPVTEMRMFYRYYEVYSNYGGLVLFGYSLLVYLKALLITFVTFCLVAVAVLAHLAVIGAVTGTVGFVKGLLAITGRQEHWWCLTVTVLTTALTGLLAGPYLIHPLVLWGVALLNGLACGLLSEFGRRAMLRFCTASQVVNRFAAVDQYQLTRDLRGRYIVPVYNSAWYRLFPQR